MPNVSSNQKFHLFTGKGGTGKTTLSSATSIYYAKKGKKTLVASIDPAHSLSDCFGIRLKNEPIKITENLYGVEIDAKEALKRDRFIIKYIHDVLKNLGIHDMDILETLPGIDEVMAYDMLVEFIENQTYDRIVYDTAPTGHALRFLSISVHIDNWLKKSFRLGRQVYGLISIAKKRRIVGASYKEEQTERDRMSKIHHFLTNPKHTSVSVVMIPEKMCIAETERYITNLHEYELPIKEIIINQIFPPSSNKFLKNKRNIQKKNIDIIKKKFEHLKIQEIPILESELIGIKEIEKINKYYPLDEGA